jgi:hypothetical protein
MTALRKQNYEYQDEGRIMKAARKQQYIRPGYTKGAIAAFFQQKLQALFYPTRKWHPKTIKNSILERKRIFFSFQRSIQIDLTPARSKVMARSD